MKYPARYLQGYRGIDGIGAFALNELQRAAMVERLGAVSARELLICDHFRGDQLNRAIWADNANRPAAPADDSANGGFGATRFNPAGSFKLLYTNCAIPAGAKNFSLAVRIRVPTKSAGHIVRCGLVNDVILSDPGQAWVGFQDDANSGNWIVSCSDIGGLVPVSGISWSSVAPSTSYQLVELHRRGSYLGWSIDGITISETDSFATGSGGGDRVYLANTLPFYIYTFGNVDAWVDVASLWVGETVAEGVNYRGAHNWRDTGEAPINVPVHREDKRVALGGVSTITVTWDRAFDTEYRVWPTLEGAAGTTMSITSQTPTDVTFAFSASVTGKLYVEAREGL